MRALDLCCFSFPELEEAVSLLNLCQARHLDDRQVMASQAQEPALGADDDAILSRGAKRGFANPCASIRQHLEVLVCCV